ncbi:hypothetical protein SNE40_019116 [Patella caerulea]|uniref:Uncharacterized protein n=1 Tax=Patella caerulea TaxID=87958 RepID=A0AAN8J6H5_PATCE
MLKSIIIVVFSCIFLVKINSIGCKSVSYKTEGGLLVNIIDDCDPKDPTSCGEGKCCSKQTMMYIPEFFGPKPTYTISCQPLTSAGRTCLTDPISTEICPCAHGLTCSPGTVYPMGSCVKY